MVELNEIVFACVEFPVAGFTCVPLKLSPCIVTPAGTLNGKFSLYTPFLIKTTSPTEADFTLIESDDAPPNCEPLSENVITSPTACPEPPFVIVTNGVDELSKITLACVPVPEPNVEPSADNVLVCVMSYVPGVPPVPPVIVSKSTTSPEVATDKA